MSFYLDKSWSSKKIAFNLKNLNHKKSFVLKLQYKERIL